jgi:hypothetical protein
VYLAARKYKLRENCALLGYCTMSSSDSLTNVSGELTCPVFKGQESNLLRSGSLELRKYKLHLNLMFKGLCIVIIF